MKHLENDMLVNILETSVRNETMGVVNNIDKKYKVEQNEYVEKVKEELLRRLNNKL